MDFYELVRRRCLSASVICTPEQGRGAHVPGIASGPVGNAALILV